MDSNPFQELASQRHADMYAYSEAKVAQMESLDKSREAVGAEMVLRDELYTNISATLYAHLGPNGIRTDYKYPGPALLETAPIPVSQVDVSGGSSDVRTVYAVLSSSIERGQIGDVPASLSVKFYMESSADDETAQVNGSFKYVGEVVDDSQSQGTREIRGVQLSEYGFNRYTVETDTGTVSLMFGPPNTESSIAQLSAILGSDVSDMQKISDLLSAEA